MFNLAADILSDLDAMAEEASTLFVLCSIVVCSARERTYNRAVETATMYGEDMPLPYVRRSVIL